MQKVVYVWNYRDWGGIQVYFASLVSKTAEHFAVEVALPEGSAPQIIERFRAAGADIFLIKNQPEFQVNGWFGRMMGHFRKHIAENRLYYQLTSKYDPANTAFHIDAGFWNSLLLLFRLSRRFHLFFTLHTPLDPKTPFRKAIWKVKGSIAGRCKNLHFLAANGGAKQSLEPFLPARTMEEVKVAYSGFEIDEIESVTANRSGRSAARQAIGVTDADFLIIVVGQLIARKGVYVLIEALPLILEAVPRSQIVWLAMSDPGGNVSSRLDEASRSFPIRLMLEADVGGRLGMLELLSTADVFLMPSLEEGLPLALAEAMALGVPSVVSKVGAVEEAITDRQTGLLIRPGDPPDLARALADMANDPQFRISIASNARSLALDKFDSRKAAGITLREYLRHLNPTTRDLKVAISE